jgi:hypothetical protein
VVRTGRTLTRHKKGSQWMVSALPYLIKSNAEARLGLVRGIGSAASSAALRCGQMRKDQETLAYLRSTKLKGICTSCFTEHPPIFAG